MTQSSDFGKVVGVEEAAKQAFGAPDPERNDRAFTTLAEVETHRPATEYFFRPTKAELEAAAGKIMRLLRRTGHILVPMHEEEPGPVAEVLEYLLSRVPADRIIVSNDRSEEPVIRTVERFARDGVNLINKEDLHALIDWDRLLPVLGLDSPPQRGKGQNILAAMLYCYLRYPNAGAIVQHDSDVNRPFQYDGLAALAYTVVARPGARILCSKVAKPGRNGQTTMTARNMCRDIGMGLYPWLPENVRRLAEEVAQDLCEHVWMLTGEFGLWKRVAYNRTFSTGYGEETFTSIFVHDCIRRHSNGKREVVAQVVTPDPRIDATNGQRKEDRMMDRLSRMLLQYVLFGKPISTWDIADFTAFNRVLGQMELTSRIPSEEDDKSAEDKMLGTKLYGPVIFERLEMDRMIPGVKALDREGFLIPDKVASFRAKHAR